jgi:hypothetical protein
VVENPLDNFSSNPFALIRFIHNDIPDCCTVDEVREDTAEPDEPISIPCAKSQIGMLEHFLCIIEGSILGPGCLME